MLGIGYQPFHTLLEAAQPVVKHQTTWVQILAPLLHCMTFATPSPWASIFSTQGNDHTYLIDLMRGLKEIIDAQVLEQSLAHCKYSVNF